MRTALPFWVIALVVACWFTIVGTAQQSPPESQFRLSQVEVTGTVRYTEAEVVEISGLNVGQVITVASLARAAERLASTGLFVSVGYRYQTAGGDMNVTLNVEEAAWTQPVVFDNFVWFDDQELLTAVRERVPGFDGTAPTEGGAVQFIAGALQQVLEARRIDGRVEFMSRTNLNTGVTQYVFRVVDAALPLTTCALNIPGAEAVPETALLDEADSGIGDEYSRAYLTDFSNGTLQRIYRRRGYWRATFGIPSGRLDSACGGVSVTLPVTEGPVYTWDGAEWTGNQVIESSDLDAMLGMKPGEVADLSKIEAGLRRVESAYGKIGHLRREATFTPDLDDTELRAVFRFTIDEGPQFHMGTIEFLGVSQDIAARLTQRWRLRVGEVYDDSYLSEFLGEHVGPLDDTGAVPRDRSSEIRVDPHTRTVDVRIVFKPAR